MLRRKLNLPEFCQFCYKTVGQFVPSTRKYLQNFIECAMRKPLKRRG